MKSQRPELAMQADSNKLRETQRIAAIDTLSFIIVNLYRVHRHLCRSHHCADLSNKRCGLATSHQLLHYLWTSGPAARKWRYISQANTLLKLSSLYRYSWNVDYHLPFQETSSRPIYFVLGQRT